MSQLRGHARKGELPLQELCIIKAWKVPWLELTPEEKVGRVIALHVYGQVKRRNISLTHAAKEEGMTASEVIKLTNAFVKKDERWVAKPRHRIETSMNINEAGESKYILVDDSRVSSIIGKYHSTLSRFFETGDARYLDEFRDVEVIDSLGVSHPLETNPDKLYAIRERRENEEYYTIYGG